VGAGAASCCLGTRVIRCGRSWPQAAPWRLRMPPFSAAALQTPASRRKRSAVMRRPASPGSPKCSVSPSSIPGCADQPTRTGSTATTHAPPLSLILYVPRRPRMRGCEPKPDPMTARDLIGYGASPPHPDWPGGALIAVNINLNIEGGGESSLINGDEVSEGMLNDIGVAAQRGIRVPLAESVFEYGSRRGAWRVLDVLREFSVRASILGVARALEQNPELTKACLDQGHEIVSHGYRWIDYCFIPEDVEREHIARAVDILTTLTGTR